MLKEFSKKRIAIIVVAASLAGFLSGCGAGAEPVVTSATDSSSSKSSSKELSHPTLAAVASGVVDVEGGIGQISASMNGIITSVFVKEGDVVKVGQILAEQENEAEQIALEEALTNLENQYAQMELHVRQTITANREVERITPLYDIGAITTSEFERATDRVLELSIQKKIQEASILKNKNDIKKAKFNLEQRKIKAPASGQIVTVEAAPGTGVSATNVTSLFTLIPDAGYIVKAQVDGSLMKEIFPGQRAELTSVYDKSVIYKATVSRISKYFKNSTNNQSMGRGSAPQQLDVTLNLADKTLLIGQKVQIRFLRQDATDKGVEK
jgi:multidrug efflux pump subunit AcrA (membrane-fusion protein)